MTTLRRIRTVADRLDLLIDERVHRRMAAEVAAKLDCTVEAVDDALAAHAREMDRNKVDVADPDSLRSWAATIGTNYDTLMTEAAAFARRRAEIRREVMA